MRRAVELVGLAVVLVLVGGGCSVESTHPIAPLPGTSTSRPPDLGMEAPEPSEDLDFASIYAAAAREIVRGSPALVHSSYRRVDPLGYRTHGELLDLGPRMDDSTKEAIEAALSGTDIRLRPNWNPVNWCNPKWASAVVSSFSWPRVIDSETVEITGEWEDRGGRGPVVLTLAQSGDEWTIIDIATGDHGDKFPQPC